MNNDEQKLREAVSKASPGPWVRQEETVRRNDGRILVAACGYCVSTDVGPERDAEFIAVARDVVPTVLADLDALRSEIADMQSKLSQARHAWKLYAGSIVANVHHDRCDGAPCRCGYVDLAAAFREPTPGQRSE